MKKPMCVLAGLVCACTLAYSQDDVQKATAEAAAALSRTPEAEQEEEQPRYWTSSSQFDLGMSNTSLWNWAAGGYNTLTANGGLDAKADYAKDLLSWKNRLQLQYGFFWSADKKNLMQKSNDVIYLESRLAFKTANSSKWNYTASFDFRSQFSNSYDTYTLDEATQTWSGTLKSGFLSPAYTNIALGMEWTPTDWFNVNIAPLTGGFTICTIDELKKNYGMKLIEVGLDPAVGSNYRDALFQFGAQIKMNFKTSINDVFTYETQLVLFTDYLDKPFRHNRVNWDNKFGWQVAKYLKLSLNTWLIYDPIVLIDGIQRVQFKESFTINFTYTIANRK